MIVQNYKKHLRFLAQGYSTLLLSSKFYSQYDEIIEYFDKSLKLNLSEENSDHLLRQINKHKIDIVIIDFTENEELALDFYNILLQSKLKLLILPILQRDFSPKLLCVVESSEGVLFEGFTSESLKNRLSTLLSLFYMLKSVGRRELKIDSGSLEMGMGLEEFFDIYEGSSLFIVDELVSLNRLLRSGDLNSWLIEKVAQKLLEIADIFEKNRDIQVLAPIFKELAIYLQELDFTTIEPEALAAFDYLCAIIDDTNSYIMDMFVDRVFKDTYIVEHSLENNIEFMKNVLESKEDENDGELEFF